MDSRPIMVSIRCATYNHAPYIRQCLEGFVMQKTTFSFEVVVHDDASTDGTTDFVREYAEKYPDIIKPMYEQENQYSKNLAGMNDAINSRLIGKYVALCEGDDYWTDPFKLQKQFDFMESHPDCSLCFHPHYCLYPNGKMTPHTFRIKKKEYAIQDLIWRGGESFSTNSFFFHRNYYLDAEKRPAFWQNCPFGDEPLMYYLALNGKVCFIDELMSVYRVQIAGSWTSQNNRSMSRMKSSFSAMLLMNRQFDEYTNYSYHSFVLLKIYRIRIRYIRAMFRHCLNYFRENSK